MSGLEAFEELESEVRSYIRAWPAVWSRAHGASLWDEDGREYLDFFSGAGGLNYGHNDPAMIEALTRYLQSQGIIHSLDMATTAKRDFLQRFNEIILKPRGMAYKVMFPGPTGTNAVEASLKLARKVTGRQDIVSFTNAFHGMTLGSLRIERERGQARVGRDPSGTSAHRAVRRGAWRRYRHDRRAGRDAVGRR